MLQSAMALVSASEPVALRQKPHLEGGTIQRQMYWYHVFSFGYARYFICHVKMKDQVFVSVKSQKLKEKGNGVLPNMVNCIAGINEHGLCERLVLILRHQFKLAKS
jgi:hypothetical protein